MSKTKENKVWLVSPVVERDANGNVTKLGYPEAVATSRRKANGLRATLNTLDSLPADSADKRVVTNQALIGW